jgi:hypothetical protein
MKAFIAAVFLLATIPTPALAAPSGHGQTPGNPMAYLCIWFPYYGKLCHHW